MNRKPVNGERAPKRGRGRPKKEDIQKYPYMFRLNDSENDRFLAMYKQSKMKSKNRFVVDKILNSNLKVIQINKSAIDFVMLLSQFFAQFRSIKTNYNQCFNTLKREVGEEKARYMMKIVKKSTIDFILSTKQIAQIYTEMRERWLPK